MYILGVGFHVLKDRDTSITAPSDISKEMCPLPTPKLGNTQDVVGLEPTDQKFAMARMHSGRYRQPSSQPPTTRKPSIGLGFSTSGGFRRSNPVGDLTANSARVSIEDNFYSTLTNGRRLLLGSTLPSPQRYSHPSRIVCSSSQGGSASSAASERTRSRRREKCGDPNKAAPAGGLLSHGSQFGYSGPSYGPGGVPLKRAVTLELGNLLDHADTSRKPQPVDAESPETVDLEVKSLLNDLTLTKFDLILNQIIVWANKSEGEKDGRTLIQVIRLVFEKATDDASWSDMYALLCQKMMEQTSAKVRDDGIKNAEGKPTSGGQLFKKYLLDRCQEDFERTWAAKEVTAAAVSKSIEDAMYSEEYYAAQKAKHQALGLIKLIGELFKLQMLEEPIVYDCIKKLLKNPEKDEIERLCKLIGAILDTTAWAHMDVYFARMKELAKSPDVSPRMQLMLLVSIFLHMYYRLSFSFLSLAGCHRTSRTKMARAPG
jgi:translation initiation factor 4G